MGTVWMADQTEPVKRRVAVKLIRVERGQSKTILSRFEAERQAIALMDHPHIAKLLDAGTHARRLSLFRHGAGQGRPAQRVLRRRTSWASASDCNFSRRSARPCSTPIRRGSSTAT